MKTLRTFCQSAEGNRTPYQVVGRWVGRWVDVGGWVVTVWVDVAVWVWKRACFSTDGGKDRLDGLEGKTARINTSHVCEAIRWSNRQAGPPRPRLHSPAAAGCCRCDAGLLIVEIDANATINRDLCG